MKRLARFRPFPRAGRFSRVLAALGALALLPACARTQAAEARPMRAEVGQVEAALAEIESRALRDPELVRMDEALGAELMEAMVREDPGLASAASLLPLLQERYGRAIQAGDAAAAAQVSGRIASIERRYLRAQSAALRDPSLAERADRFHALLRRRMVETDAAAESLFRRYAKLREQMDS
jgi:hypothetical protein